MFFSFLSVLCGKIAYRARAIYPFIDKRNSMLLPLQGFDKGLHHIRQGDYRIVYHVNEKEIVVLVVRIAHHSEGYAKKHSN